MSLVDDLSAAAIERMKAEGFEPSAVVEKPRRITFQVWLDHGQALEVTTSTAVAKQLAESFGGDLSRVASHGHFQSCPV